MRAVSLASTGLSSSSWALPFPKVRSVASGSGTASKAVAKPSSLVSSQADSSFSRASFASSSIELRINSLATIFEMNAPLRAFASAVARSSASFSKLAIVSSASVYF